MWGNELFHPFSFYSVGQPQTIGHSHYLRISPHVLWKMQDLGNDSFTAKRKVYNGYEVQEYKMDDDEIKKFEEHLEKNKEVQKLREESLKKLQAPLANAKVFNFKSSETVMVLPHEYAVTKETSDQPVLGSFGAGDCVILALYDSKNKIAVLAHIDTMTVINSLSTLFNFISKEHTVAHLFGGTDASKVFCMNLVELLEQDNIKIVNSDIVRFSWESASLAIDSRTGFIYEPVSYAHMNYTSDLDMRVNITLLQSFKSPLNECYNGLEIRASSSQTLSETTQKTNIKNEPKLSHPQPLSLGFLSKEKVREKSNEPIQPTYCNVRSSDERHFVRLDAEKPIMLSRK